MRVMLDVALTEAMNVAAKNSIEYPPDDHAKNTDTLAEDREVR